MRRVLGTALGKLGGKALSKLLGCELGTMFFVLGKALGKLGARHWANCWAVNLVHSKAAIAEDLMGWC